jgi:hypothetical protein
MPACKARDYLIEVPLIYIPLWGMQHETRIGFELSHIENFAQMAIAQQSQAKKILLMLEHFTVCWFDSKKIKFYVIN